MINPTHWAENILKNKNYIFDTSFIPVIQTPWSKVWKILTHSHGLIYLKKNVPSFSLEPRVIQFLSLKNPNTVPRIIAENQELYCFLMQDSGVPLKEIFQNKIQPDLLAMGLQQYIDLQNSLDSKDIQTLLKLGVSDWRLEKLPGLYHSVLDQENLLLEDGLSSEEINLVKKLEPKFIELCNDLSSFKIKEIFDHPDLHDENLLLDPKTKNFTLIDFGEVSITHPFFSRITFLKKLSFRYVLKETDPDYLSLKNTGIESNPDHLNAWSLAEKIWPLYAIFGELRLINSCDPIAFKKFNRRGRLSVYFREWIRNTGRHFLT